MKKKESSTKGSDIALITYKNEEDPMKNEGARVLTTFPPL